MQFLSNEAVVLLLKFMKKSLDTIARSVSVSEDQGQSELQTPLPASQYMIWLHAYSDTISPNGEQKLPAVQYM